jgi:hypothetical protein
MFRLAFWACLIVPVVGPTAAGAEIWFKVEYFEWAVRPIEEDKPKMFMSNSVPAEAKLVASVVALAETGKHVVSRARIGDYEVGFRGIARGGKDGPLLVEVEPTRAQWVQLDRGSRPGRDLQRTHMEFLVKPGERWVLGGMTSSDGRKTTVSAWAVTVTKDEPKDPDDESDK